MDDYSGPDDISWAKLPNGTWGISVPKSDPADEGDTVTVKRANGSTSRVVLGVQVNTRGNYRIFEQGRAGAPRRAKPAAPAEPKPKGISVEIPAGPVPAADEPARPEISDDRARQNAEVLWNGGIDETGDLTREPGKKVWPLDDEQKRISLWRPHMGNVRVLAAAGSGKTRTTVALVSRLIHDGVLKPHEIVVTTFTNKAAAELVSRLTPVLSGDALDKLRVGTFHSLAFAAKKKNAALRAKLPHESFMDPRAVANLWRQILDEVWYKESPRGYIPGTNKKSLGDQLRELNDGEDPDVKGYATAVDVARSAPGDAAVIRERLETVEVAFPLITEAWDLFCESKQAHGGWDFADVLSEWEMALAQGVATDSAKLVIVDEAQDNNLLQASIAMLLARNGKGNVILVGDVRQSIYAWRGAEPKIMIEADDTLGAKTMEITTNYRSTKKIVALGNAISKGKDYAVGQPSKASPYAEEGLITLTGAEDVVGEADLAAARIKDAMQGRKPDDPGYSRFAILGRTRAQGGAAEAALVSKRIPCAVVGGTSFFKRNEVVGVLAWIKALSGLPVDKNDIQKMTKYPTTGLGASYADSLVEYLASRDPNFVSAVDMVVPHVNHHIRQKAEDFAMTVIGLSARIGEAQGSPEERWLILLDELGTMFADKFKRDENKPVAEDGDAKADPALVVMGLAKTFPGPAALIQFAAQCSDEVVELPDEVTQNALPPGKVVISTIHKAKGLEWPVVFVSASLGQFPSKRSTNVGEEERCFYVAVTRAAEECHLSYAAQVNGKPAGASPFLDYVRPFVRR